MTSENRARCILLERCLKECLTVFEPYLAFTNAHNTDFITHNMWEKYVDPNIAEAVLKLSVDELARLPGRLSEKPHEKSKHHTSDESTQAPTSTVPTEDEGLPAWPTSNLEDFLTSIASCTLPNLGVDTSLETLMEECLASTKYDAVSVQHLMTEKKCHEVDIMADVCTRLAESRKIKEVVDMGSGKGYLSSRMALMYGLHVIGVDASQSFTNSANQRNVKLNSKWDSFVKTAKSKGQGIDKQDIMSQSSNHGLLKSSSDTKTCDNTESKPGTYIPLAQFIDSSTDLKHLLREHLGLDSGSDRILLTGLHTCGNLASSMLRIFTENDDVHCVCNVGCCYQQLEEEFVPNPFDEVTVNEAGFPMSSFLKSQEVKLGRNSRMLASQPMDRIAAGALNSQKSLFWRAVLQQMLVDLTGTVRKDWQVGKIAKKSPDFHVYVRKALNKLGMQEENKKVTDSQIEDYLIKYAAEEKKVFAFFQLRACFGPLVEAVILLDRLLYLLEQDHISQAYLTRLFDPVKSPRCYAIIALRNSFGAGTVS